MVPVCSPSAVETHAHIHADGSLNIYTEAEMNGTVSCFHGDGRYRQEVVQIAASCICAG